ncbi:protein FAM205C [Orycteropus afer afer]|uniref:Protein FAM205C n=1 Tax=Orycteropus afer afer TaxID=1230840 RepID=A0AC54Z8F8_ORYAF|nr:protein FAM205C [Orycteropus afer afer]
MMSPTYVQWDIVYSLYNFGSIFIIVLIIWQVKKIQHGLRLGHNRSCCWRHRRVRQRTREAVSRARRTSPEEAEKPQKLLSLLKSQGWLPQEGHVRRLLCADPCCHICNDMALEIQQLLTGDNTLAAPTSAGASLRPSCLGVLSTSAVSEESRQRGSRHCRVHSLAPLSPALPQARDQQSSPQTAARSTGPVSAHEDCDEHLQLGQEVQLPDASWDPQALCPSRLEKPRAPVSRQERNESSSGFSLEKQEAAETSSVNKMKYLLHWIYPKMEGQGHEECSLSNPVTVSNARAKKVERSPDLTYNCVRATESEKPAGGPKAQPPHAEESLHFSSAPQSVPVPRQSQCPGSPRARQCPVSPISSVTSGPGATSASALSTVLN